MKLPITSMEHRVGAAPNPTAYYNIEMWIEIERVVSYVNSRKNWYKSLIPVVQLNSNDDLKQLSLGDRDSLYFYGHEHHCYVILFVAKSRKCLIGDGTNRYLDNRQAQEALDEATGAQIMALDSFSRPASITVRHQLLPSAFNL